MDDIFDYYVENSNKNYFTGTLVCNLRIQTGDYEAIDGQQRLTTFNLIMCALRHFESDSYLLNGLDSIYNEPNIIFEARPISDDSIKHVYLNGKEKPKFSNFNQNIISAISIIESRLKYIKKLLNSSDREERLKDKSFGGFVKYLREKVILVRVQVPEQTDLNHYFEIMNSRGEQLEKHEILKARLMKELNGSENAKLVRRQFNIIWEACSQMDTYVQLLLNKSFRTKIFGNRWFSFKIKSFDDLSGALDLQNSEKDNSLALNEIIRFENSNEIKIKIEKLNNEDVVNDSDSKQFQPIINFENFLLHVLKLQCPNLDVSLDDKRLLLFFKNAIEHSSNKELFAKEFIYNLLKTRFLLDTYVLKRKYQGNDNFWSLNTLKFYPKNNEGRDEDSFNYVNTFEETKMNNEIILLLSMFHVSTPTLVYKYWLFGALKYLNDNYKNIDDPNLEYPCGIDTIDYQNSLIKQAKVFLKYRFLNPEKESSYESMIYYDQEVYDFEVKESLLEYGNIKNNLVFNYIDFLLWRRKKNDDKFEFSFRSSVEHFYPQHPDSGPEIEDKSILNCIGNLCLISHENNSRYSNFPPIAKKSHYLSNDIKESIKQAIMMEKAETWNEKEIIEHRDFIYQLLEDDLNH